jgi:hypothetical protein
MRDCAVRQYGAEAEQRECREKPIASVLPLCIMFVPIAEATRRANPVSPVVVTWAKIDRACPACNSDNWRFRPLALAGQGCATILPLCEEPISARRLSRGIGTKRSVQLPQVVARLSTENRFILRNPKAVSTF